MTAPHNDDGVTRQSFRDECDIDRIVDTYARTGMVNHIPRMKPMYGDAPDQTLFEAACVQAEIRSAEENEALYPPSDALTAPESDDKEQTEGTPSEPEPEAPTAAKDESGG